MAVPGRRSASASALRFAAVVVAEQLAAAIYEAGGEPLVLFPSAEGDNGDRFGWADALVLPGGGDLDPSSYGERPGHPELYDVDPLQDAFDLALARSALDRSLPVLAVCRGMQVVNVALGGTLVAHMDQPHRARTHHVRVEQPSRLHSVLSSSVAEVSCHHHQRIAALGDGLVATARSDDDTIEALELPRRSGYLLAVQWHPEDTFDRDPVQERIFSSLVDAARP